MRLDVGERLVKVVSNEMTLAYSLRLRFLAMRRRQLGADWSCDKVVAQVCSDRRIDEQELVDVRGDVTQQHM